MKVSSIYKLAILNDADFTNVMAARGRLSEDMHAAADTLNPESITHATFWPRWQSLRNGSMT